ncbi:MAG: hypothetical protein GY853_03690 [PVC group bacterium]|nr:hypothetical protein [PVC group bacterium]
MRLKSLFRLLWILVMIFMFSGQLLATEASELLDFKIPSSWGVIRDSFDAGTDKIVINIQDAHANLEAQENIAKILDRLVSQYNLELVALEGASGKIDATVLSAFPDNALKKDVSAYFLQEGKISGAEYLAVNSDYDFKLYGVEDFDLYLDNLEAFHNAQDFKKEAAQYIATIGRSLDSLKPYIYNEGLTEIDELKKGRSTAKISFSQYVVGLADMLREYSLSVEAYPAFFELQKVVKLEGKVDFVKADEDRAKLITALTEGINTKEDLVELVDKSLQFKKGTLTASVYANFLKDMAFKIRLNLAPYEEFCTYADYISSYEKVPNDQLFAEIKSVETALRDQVYTDDTQKELDKLYTHLGILDKLVSLTMLTEDIDYFFEYQEEINTDTFSQFVEEQAEELAVMVVLPADISYLDVYLPIWTKFYDLAHERDISLIENTLSKMDSDDMNFAALITGGFHTEKLAKILKEKNISYLVLTPRISQHDTTPYLELMGGKQSILDDFVEQMQSTLQTMSNLMETDGSMSTETQQMVKDKSDSFKSAVIITSFGRFAAQRASEGMTNIEAVKEEFKETFTQNVDTDLKGLVKKVIDNENLTVKLTPGSVQGIATVGLNNNKNASLVFSYTKESGASGQQFAVLDKEPVIIPVATGAAIALAEGIGMDLMNASPKAVIQALVESGVSGKEVRAQTYAAISKTIIKLSSQTGITTAEVKAELQNTMTETALPVDKQEQLVNVLTNFVVGVEEAKTPSAKINMLQAVIDIAPVATRIGEAVSVDLGLTDTKSVDVITQGATQISKTPQQKKNIVANMAKTLNIEVAILNTAIDSAIMPAVTAESPAVIRTAKSVVAKLDLFTAQVETVKTSLAQISINPEAKAQIITDLAEALNFDAGTNLSITQVTNAIDTAIIGETVTVNAGEIKTAFVQQGMDAGLAADLADVVKAELGINANIETIDALADIVLEKTQIDVTAAGIDENTLKSQFTQGLSTVVVTAAAIQPANVSISKVADVADTGAQQQAEAIVAQISPEQVVAIRGLVELQQPDMKDKAIEVTGGDVLVSEIKGALENVGINAENTIMTISLGNYSDGVKVNVTHIGKTSFVSISSVNKSTEKVVKNKSSSLLSKIVASVGDDLQINSDWSKISSSMAEYLTSTNAERLTDSGLPITVADNNREKIGKKNVLAIDMRYLATVEKLEDGKGVTLKLSAVGSEAIFEAITKKIDIIAYIPEEMMGEQGKTMDTHDLVRGLEELGIPMEHFSLVVDKKIAQHVSGVETVSLETVKAVAEKKHGANNVRMHFAVQDNPDDVAILQKMEGVTYTVFKAKLEPTEVRVMDYDMPKMLTSMILGKSQELTQEDKEAAVGVILASINVDWSKADLKTFSETGLESLNETTNKTEYLDKKYELVVAFGTEA